MICITSMIGVHTNGIFWLYRTITVLLTSLRKSFFFSFVCLALYTEEVNLQMFVII